MATGEGSGDEPLSCIQRFSGRKVIRQLLFSMLRRCERKRWREEEGGKRREVEVWETEGDREMKGEERKVLEETEMEGEKVGRPGREKTRHKNIHEQRKCSNRAIKERARGRGGEEERLSVCSAHRCYKQTKTAQL